MLNKTDKYTGLTRFGYPVSMPDRKRPPKQLALIDMPKKETMGQRIRRLREEMRLTQDQLSRRCGVAKSAVAQWELGTSENIKLQPFLRLLRVFEVSHEYLLFGQESAPPGFYLEGPPDSAREVGGS